MAEIGKGSTGTLDWDRVNSNTTSEQEAETKQHFYVAQRTT